MANLEEYGTNLALLIKGTRDAGVRVVSGHDLKAVDGGVALLEGVDGRENAQSFDHLFVSRGYTPRLELKSAIDDAQLGCEVLMVGDCVEVRNFFDAINEGAHVVRSALG